MEVRFDWVTFSISESMYEGSLQDLTYDLLGLDLTCFVPCRGRHGYKNGLFYENITILTEGGVPGMGTCFSISGKGCTYLYSLEEFNFEDLFKKINSLSGNISRLDVALDCFDHELPYDELIQATETHNYSSRWRTVKVTKSFTPHGNGFDIQFGSRCSDIMLRIYDKKVESGCEDKDYWCRLELQCRNELAHAFADTFADRVEDLEYVHKFMGVLQHYLRYIDRRYKNDPTHCLSLVWWERFIDNVAKSRILRHTDYESATVEQLIYNVRTRFSQSFKLFIDVFGQDALLNLLGQCHVTSRHYLSLSQYLKQFNSIQLGTILENYMS